MQFPPVSVPSTSRLLGHRNLCSSTEAAVPPPGHTHLSGYSGVCDPSLGTSQQPHVIYKLPLERKQTLDCSD